MPAPPLPHQPSPSPGHAAPRGPAASALGPGPPSTSSPFRGPGGALLTPLSPPLSRPLAPGRCELFCLLKPNRSRRIASALISYGRVWRIVNIYLTPSIPLPSSFLWVLVQCWRDAMNSIRCLFSKRRRGRSEDGKWEKPGLTPFVSVSRHRRRWFPPPCLSVPCWGPSGHRGNSGVNRPLSCLWSLLASLSFLFPPSGQQTQTPPPQTGHPPGHLARWRGSCLDLRAKGRGHGACQASRHKSPAPASAWGRSWWLRLRH